jgi:16S rRNA processing protein RimM
LRSFGRNFPPRRRGSITGWTAGERVGEIAAVEPGPAHDWLVVRREDGESPLPMVSAFIREVDVPGRRIVVAPPEGW